MVLVDALREDFVEFDQDKELDLKHPRDASEIMHIKEHTYLNLSKSVYKGQKIETLNNLLIDEPFNTILLPMEADQPTVTTVRVRTILTGAMSSMIELKEDFANDLVEEDNIPYQMKNYIGDFPKEQ